MLECGLDCTVLQSFMTGSIFKKSISPQHDKLTLGCGWIIKFPLDGLLATNMRPGTIRQNYLTKQKSCKLINAWWSIPVY